MESSVLASINEVPQRQESVIIDLENEFSSMAPTISATKHIGNNSTKTERRVVHSLLLESSSVTQANNRRATEYLPQRKNEPEAYHRTMVFN